MFNEIKNRFEKFKIKTLCNQNIDDDSGKDSNSYTAHVLIECYMRAKMFLAILAKLDIYLI